MAKSPQPRSGKILRVDVEGKDPALWKQQRGKLMAAIERVLNAITEGQPAGEWVAARAREFSAALLEHAKARLAKAGLENEKIAAEVEKLYSEREKTLADARKVHAEAETIEFETALKRLRLALEFTKAMLIGEEGEEALLFGEQIDAFLEELKALAAS